MKEQIVITAPNKILSEVSRPVTSFDVNFKKQAEILHQTLKKADFGIGLAANQIGINSAVFVVEYDDPKGKETIPLQFFVNPEIAQSSDEKEVMEEGCISIPGIFLDVERSNKIKVKAQDLNGKRFKLTAKGLLARLILHEADHLHGKIFTQLAQKQLHEKKPDLKNLNIIFIGTGEFAETILRGLILLGFNISTVITEEIHKSGRNQKPCKTPVAEIAAAFRANIIETSNIKKEYENINQLKPDLIILADFGQLIPLEILEIPKIMSINLHPSLLPKFRGATPIQSAILSGEKETGLSIIKMSAKIDQGEILAQQTLEISKNDNYLSLRDRLANLGLNMLLILLPKLQKGKFEILTQEESNTINTHKLTKETGLIDWKKSATIIDRQIRALLGWPGSYTFIDEKRLIIHQAHLDRGKLVIDVVQPEGKNIMLWSDFLRGFKGKKPQWFSKIRLEK